MHILSWLVGLAPVAILLCGHLAFASATLAQGTATTPTVAPTPVATPAAGAAPAPAGPHKATGSPPPPDDAPRAAPPAPTRPAADERHPDAGKDNEQDALEPATEHDPRSAPARAPRGGEPPPATDRSQPRASGPILPAPTRAASPRTPPETLAQAAGTAPSTAQAAASANDSFAGATTVNVDPVALPYFYQLNTSLDTVEPSEPTSFGAGCDTSGLVGHTVWYRFTPATSMRIAITTASSDYDTVLRVFTGSSVGALSQVACNDQANDSNQSRVSFSAVAGQTYRVQVGGYYNAAGNLTITFSADNDAFAGAVNVAQLPAQFYVDTRAAGTEPGEPTTFTCETGTFQFGNTVWYRLTPAFTQSLTISTFSSNYDTAIRVYTGSSVGALTPAACNDEFLGYSVSELTFTASAGVTYRIQVSAYQDPSLSIQGGDLWLSFNPPTNDHFVKAEPVTSLSSSARTTRFTRSATEDPSEPVSGFACDAGAGTIDSFSTVWYRLNLPSTSQVTIDSSLSNFDTVIRVFTGSAVNALTPVTNGCNDQFNSRNQARLSFTASAGVNYYVQVGGYFNSQGDLIISFSQTVPAPSNDNFASAQLVPVTGQQSANTGGATLQAGEPNACNTSIFGATVWYRLVGDGSTISVDTFGSSFDTVLAVYTGSSVSALTMLACSDDARDSGGNATLQSRVGFRSQLGTSYYVQAGGYRGLAGSLLVNMASLAPPANDNFAAPATISIGSQLTADTRGAGTETSEPTSFVCDPQFPTVVVGKSVWYTFTAASSTPVVISTGASNFDTVVRIYTGSAVGALSAVACNDQYRGSFQSRLSFVPTSGQTYRIQVSGFAGYSGASPTQAAAGNLVVDMSSGLVNDNLANATVVSAGSSATVNTTAATTQAQEQIYFTQSDPLDPQCRGVILDKTVWYKLTGTGSPVSINTTGSTFDTVLRVYVGPASSPQFTGLTPVACNDDVSGSLQARVTVPTSAGTTYYIQAGGYFTGAGSLVLNVGSSSPPPPAPTEGPTPGPTRGPESTSVTSAWTCAPVTVQTTQNTATGRLAVSVSASAYIRELRFGGSGNNVSRNELIDILGLTGRSGVFSVPVGAATSVAFSVGQRASGSPTTVFFTVSSDSCGDWPTFVGGGPSAFPTTVSLVKATVASVGTDSTAYLAGDVMGVTWRLPDVAIQNYVLVLAATGDRDGDAGKDQRFLSGSGDTRLDWRLSPLLPGGAYEVRLLRIKNGPVEVVARSATLSVTAASPPPPPPVAPPATTPVPAPITAGAAAVDSTGAVGQYTALRLDAQGNPVVSYYDAGADTLKVLHCGDPVCSRGNTVATPDASRGVGQYTSLVLDARGHPVVSYYDATNARLKMLKCGDPTCTRDNVISAPDATRGVGQYSSLTLDSKGNPVVSYYDAGNGALRLLHCGDASCSSRNTLTVVDQVGPVGQYTSLALDTLDNPVISYYDQTARRLRLVRCGNATCTQANLIAQPDSSQNVGQDSALALDPTSKPVVLYFDATSSRLKLLRCADLACQANNVITALELGGPVGSQASLALDVRGNPVVAYVDSQRGGLHVLHCGNAACTAGNTTAPADAAREVGQFNALVLDASGRPVLSYYDAASRALKVVHCRSVNCN